MSAAAGRPCGRVRHARKQARNCNRRCTPIHADGTWATASARLARAGSAIPAVNDHAGFRPIGVHRCASVVAFACFAACRAASPGWARHGTTLGEGAASLMVHGVLPCMREAAARQVPMARCPSRCMGCCPRRRSSPRPSAAGRHSPARTRPPPWQAFGSRLARVRPAKARPRRVRHGQLAGPSLFRRLNGWRKRSPQGLSCRACGGTCVRPEYAAMAATAPSVGPTVGARNRLGSRPDTGAWPETPGQLRNAASCASISPMRRSAIGSQ
jgi:hypothetical protein